jgi:hypothetical protein
MSTDIINTETVKHTGDGLAAFVTIASVVEWLPPLAALLTIIWTALRIYEWVEGRIKGE